MREQHAAALVCLKDAKQHALAAADYEMAAAIRELQDKFYPKPKTCPTCGSTKTPGEWRLDDREAAK